MSASENEEQKFVSYALKGLAGIAFILLIMVSIYGIQFPTPFGDQEKFAQFGDYIGGLLNPLLGFLTVALLILSVRFQITELRLTRTELEQSKDAFLDANKLSSAAEFSTSARHYIDEIYKQVNDLNQQECIRFNSSNMTTERWLKAPNKNKEDFVTKCESNQFNSLYNVFEKYRSINLYTAELCLYISENNIERVVYRFKLTEIGNKLEELADTIRPFISLIRDVSAADIKDPNQLMNEPIIKERHATIRYIAKEFPKTINKIDKVLNPD